MIATLISDFGYGDNSVAIAKGGLLSHNPLLSIVDISHAVSPHNLIQCSYLLKSTFAAFPKNTVHLALFDILNQLPAKVLLCKIDDQIIVSADNGLLGFTFGELPITIWKYDIADALNFNQWILNVAKLLTAIEQANFDLKQVKLEAYKPIIEVMPLKALVKQNAMECHVLHIDRYGNVVLNISKETFETQKGDRNFSVRIPRHLPLNKITHDYAELTNGMVFCTFNSAGYLEIGVKNASAAQLLGLKAFEKDQMIYNTINIEFI